MLNQKLRRRGFTVVETIVVLGIAAILCAILIPAIQSSRQNARLNQCKERLKQIGLALHNYEENYKTFPPGFVLGGNDRYHGWSWSVFIMPFMDSNRLYNAILFESGLQSEYLKKDLHTHMAMFRCPSDAGPDVVASVAIITTPVVDWVVTPASVHVKNTFARSNFFGSAGYLHANAGGIEASDPATSDSADVNMNKGSLGTPATKYSLLHKYADQENFHGFFGQNSSVRIRDIHDGLSNTIMVGERYTPRPSLNGQQVIGDGGWLGVSDPTTAAALAMALGDTSIDIKSNINRQPTTGFGSSHYGGANLLLGDGRVRTVNAKINPKTYRDLSDIDEIYRNIDIDEMLRNL